MECLRASIEGECFDLGAYHEDSEATAMKLIYDLDVGVRGLCRHHNRYAKASSIMRA